MAGMLFATIMPAQELALLPSDPAVKCSVLPDGLSCYVAENGSVKGMADFVLVRRDYSGNEDVLTFNDVLTASETAMDSTLLVMMRRVARDAAPADHAVIVCGDVDASSVITRLKYMSLMVDASEPSPIPEYEWNGDGKVKVYCVRDTLKGLSTVCCGWSAARTPVEYMNTVQSALYEKTAWELGDVACRLIRRNLRNSDIPVADVSYSHTGAVDGMVDEGFSIRVTVESDNAEAAQTQIMAVLAAIDDGNVGISDFLLAENSYLLSLERLAGRPVTSNGEYVRMCTEAFLYNRPLSTDRERLEFFRSKDVPADVRSGMFTGIASALLDVADRPDEAEAASAGIMLSDTLALPGPGLKQKVRSSRKDPFSGGVVWTFENGFKVIYKMMPTARTMYYSLSLNGGFANAEGLERGEAAYMSDYMDCCWVAGMKGRDFRDMLRLAGMTLDMRVNLHGTVVSGQVKDRNASLMMKSLLALSEGCRPDTTSARYYAESMNLRGVMNSGKDIRATVDSLMCPGFRYTPFRIGEGVSENTFAKADRLFENLFSKMNDGVLVIVGDMPESELKKLLQVYVGGFKVRSVASRRPSIQYHPVSGWLRYSVEGETDASVVAVSGTLPMTASNHFASEIAAMILERRIRERFSGEDVSVRLSYSRSIYPDERLSIYVLLDGTCRHEDALEIRRLLADCSESIDADVLKACREYMKNAYALQMRAPEYWLRVIPLRHLEGKDFTSGCAAKIDAVTAEQVKNIFETLEKGAGVEYVIKKN